MYGVVFRFGAFLVTQPVGSILHVEFNDVFRVFFALVFGALAVGQAGSFAPDYKKAKLSANRIFELLDRKPVIDGESEEGSKLVSSSKNSLSCSRYPESWWVCQGGVFCCYRRRSVERSR